MLYGLDLFSGIGGLTKALGPWVRPVAYCEIDAYCRGVLLSRMADGFLPVTPIWDDVRTLRGDMLPEVDIIYGGFPCQDISTAGLGKGLAGERSGLVFEVFRLIRETGAPFVFLENVPAIRTRGGERVVKELAALGYDCRWDCLSAFDVGAPHRRERWWLLAYSDEARRARERQTQSKEWRGDSESPGGRASVADSGSQSQSEKYEGYNPLDKQRPTIRGRQFEPSGIGAGGRDKSWANPLGNGANQERPEGKTLLPNVGSTDQNFNPKWWDVEPELDRVANGIPYQVDRISALGNAVVPAQAREAFQRLIGFKP